MLWHICWLYAFVIFLRAHYMCKSVTNSSWIETFVREIYGLLQDACYDWRCAAVTWTFQFLSKQNKIHLFCYMLLHSSHNEDMHSRRKLAIENFKPIIIVLIIFFRSACSLARFATLSPLLGCRCWMGVQHKGLKVVPARPSFSYQSIDGARAISLYLHSACLHTCTPNTLGMAWRGKNNVWRVVPLFGIYTSWLVTYSAYKM